jgi:hypothetical protein
MGRGGRDAAANLADRASLFKLSATCDPIDSSQNGE